MERKTKKCSGKCGLELPVDQFYRVGKYYQGKCITCVKEYVTEWKRQRTLLQTEQERSYAANWIKEDRQKNPEKYRQQALKSFERWLKKIGSSLAEYEAKKVSQGNCCAICKRELKLVQDHDHKTKLARGLLCISCNSLLGRLEEKTAWFANWEKNAREYLEIFANF
jgi:hypothetical protein